MARTAHVGARVVDCVRVGLDTDDAPVRPDEVGERPREQADTAVQIEGALPRLRVGLVDDGVEERRCGARVHLPETAGTDVELRTAVRRFDDLADGRRDLTPRLRQFDADDVVADTRAHQVEPR